MSKRRDRDELRRFLHRPARQANGARLILTPGGFAFTIEPLEDIADQVVAVSSSDGSTLTGVALGTIVYGPGQLTGWLSALASDDETPLTVTLTIVTDDMVEDEVYDAYVPVTSPDATGSPQSIHVRVTVPAAELVSGGTLLMFGRPWLPVMLPVDAGPDLSDSTKRLLLGLAP